MLSQQCQWNSPSPDTLRHTSQSERAKTQQNVQCYDLTLTAHWIIITYVENLQDCLFHTSPSTPLGVEISRGCRHPEKKFCMLANFVTTFVLCNHHSVCMQPSASAETFLDTAATAFYKRHSAPPSPCFSSGSTCSSPSSSIVALKLVIQRDFGLRPSVAQETATAHPALLCPEELRTVGPPQQFPWWWPSIHTPIHLLTHSFIHSCGLSKKDFTAWLLKVSGSQLIGVKSVCN